MTREPCRIAIVGAGKIARDQHLPAIAADHRFTLVAAADPVGSLAGVPTYSSLGSLLAEGPELDAVSVCTPPRGRGALVMEAIRAGLHVMIEKPPAMTLCEVSEMRHLAESRGVTLFAAWHSREAGAVAPAKAWLATRRITDLSIRWREDIRRWHPGQDWILEAGGFGVFDPGINAISIATEILPERLFVTRALFKVPSNRQSPIAARLFLTTGNSTGTAELDFLDEKTSCWEIAVSTDGGPLLISEGGRRLTYNDQVSVFEDNEYTRLYDCFLKYIQAGRSLVDARPSRLVADAFMIAERTSVESFEW